MNPLNAGGFIAWTDRLIRLPWLLTLDVFRGTAAGFGWFLTDRPWEPVVDFIDGPRRMVLFEGRSGGIRNMSFPLIKPPSESTEDAA